MYWKCKENYRKIIVIKKNSLITHPYPQMDNWISSVLFPILSMTGIKIRMLRLLARSLLQEILKIFEKLTHLNLWSSVTVQCISQKIQIICLVMVWEVLILISSLIYEIFMVSHNLFSRMYFTHFNIRRYWSAPLVFVRSDGSDNIIFSPFQYWSALLVIVMQLYVCRKVSTLQRKVMQQFLNENIF